MDAPIKERPEIALTRVDSSQIESIGHDAEHNILAIQFKAKDESMPGSIYHYENFTAADFEAFKNAESIGSHFYKYIKHRPDLYPYVRIS